MRVGGWLGEVHESQEVGEVARDGRWWDEALGENRVMGGVEMA